MLTWPETEAAVMRREYPQPCPDEWYEARKWPRAWGLLGKLSGQRVLDVGCHTGWIGWLAQECGAEVTATDIFHTARHRSLNFLLAMKEELPFADGSFDQVVTANVLHHGELAPALREIARVLKPGGRFTSLQEPCIPLRITEEQEQQTEECAREIAKGVTERRYHGCEYRQALGLFFAESHLWQCNGSPLEPVAHTHEPITWEALDTYHGGIGVQAVKA